MSAAAPASTDIDSVCEDATKSAGDENAFQSALDEMKEGGLFGQVEIAALRLAAARTDDALTQVCFLVCDRAVDRTVIRFASTTQNTQHNFIMLLNLIHTGADEIPNGGHEFHFIQARSSRCCRSSDSGD